MNRKSAIYKRVISAIDENLLTNLKQSPRQVSDFYTDNFFQRGLSYLIGLTESGNYKPVKISDGGAVKVASVGGGLSYMKSYTGVATNTESSQYDLTNTASRLRFVGVDYDLLVRTSPDGVTWGDQIYIPAGKPETVDIICSSFKVQRNGSNDVNYKIECYR